jgi:hypothetical protein
MLLSAVPLADWRNPIPTLAAFINAIRTPPAAMGSQAHARVKVDGAGLVVMDGSPLTVNQSGELQPRVQIFSDYSSASVASAFDHNSSGFTIAGDSAYYATVYAPFTDASITGSAQITGSLWAQRVKVPGAATINYDVALQSLPPAGGVVLPGGPPEAAGPLVLTIEQWQEI